MPQVIDEFRILNLGCGSSNRLRELNQLLTAAMSERKIQTLIKDDNLDLVIESVLEHTADSDQQLLTAAILGRLAAVARGRESRVYDRADEVLTKNRLPLKHLMTVMQKHTRQ